MSSLRPSARGLSIEALQAKTGANDVNDARDRIVPVGAERYRLRVKDLAEVFRRSRGTVSRRLSRATRRRASTPEVTSELDDFDRPVASMGWRNITERAWHVSGTFLARFRGTFPDATKLGYLRFPGAASSIQICIWSDDETRWVTIPYVTYVFAWSPDSRWIYYTKNEGDGEIWRIDLEMPFPGEKGWDVPA